ncbi:VWFA and cache domain-containing protein 1-like isoform X2 [Lineus longissimus]|uniref:VWFA and cache domain-containing protein 1-like isoform X2 n=1 Tax=Lineus longissimus TaxID=88925 RepID=UPI00315C6CD6
MRTRRELKLFHLCVVTGIVLFSTPVPKCDAEPWIKAANFDEDVVMLRNKGLRVKSWQTYLDNIQYQSADISTGSNLIKKVAGTISRKSKRLIDSIKLLKTAVEKDYENFTATPHFNRCCQVTNLTFDARFFTGVDVDTACDLISKASALNKTYPTKAVMEVMKKNLQEDPSMKWQYFGTEEGISTVYPANKYSKPCGMYEPRIRPWYVEAATPTQKDVVLVIDHSFSMRLLADPTQSQDPTTLMDIAKEAASAVLDTLDPHDMVGVVKFNEEASTLAGCYSTGLAHASEHNIKTLKTFVQGLNPSGGTSYLKALNKAFDFFDAKASAGNTEKVILFLTDGEPQEGHHKIIKVVKERQTALNNSVTIMTYGLGADIGDAATLKGMANVATNKKGTFTHVTDPSNLRNKMAFFYKKFQTTDTQNILFTIPYFDAFGLGMVTTLADPAYHNGRLIGVIGVDLPLNDLFSDYRFERNYVFVIDLTGRAWIHPLLAKATGDELTTNIDIGVLERNKEAEEVIESMKRGENGTKVLVSYHVQALGDPFRDGVVRQNLNSTYYWTKVEGMNLSVCLVMASGEDEGIVDENSPNLNKSVPFTYHRSDIEPPEKPCRHFQRISEERSVLQFSPESFKEPAKYLETNETAKMIEAMEKYLTFASNDNPGFLDDIRATVAMTNQADEIWQTNRKTKVTDFIVWRYIGTNNGIMRIVPSAMIAKAFNPVYRSWYTRAVSQPGKSVFSTPYLDVAGAGIVVTMSQSLYTGRNTTIQAHSTNDTIIGVLGIDFTLAYFYNRLQETFPTCREAGFECYIIDNSGYLVIHEDFIEAKTLAVPEMENMHITVKDPDLARRLISGGYMKEQGCINIKRMREQVSWKVDIGPKIVVEMKDSDPKYEVASVRASNIFLVVKQLTNSGIATPCSCIPKSAESVEKYECKAAGSCQCPCHNHTTYKACEDKLDINNSYWTCPPGSPALDIPPIPTKEKEMALSLAYCYQQNCTGNIKTTCMSRMGCSWCKRDKTGGLLDKPYCAPQHVCYWGIECMPDPYEPESSSSCPTATTATTPSTNTTQAPLGLIVGCTVGGVVFIVGIIVMVVLLVRCRQGKTACPARSPSGPNASTMTRMARGDSIQSGLDNPHMRDCPDVANVEPKYISMLSFDPPASADMVDESGMEANYGEVNYEW